MREDQKISSKQLKALIVSTVIGVGILTLPNTIALVSGNDGWMVIILGGLLTVPSLIIMNKLFELYPDKDFFQIGREVLGKWIFSIFLLVFLAHFIVLSALATRELAEVIRAFLLLTTPTEVIIVTFILATSYIARLDIQVISRSAYHIYPIIIGFMVVLTLIALTGVDFTNMLPVFQSDLKLLPRGIGKSLISFIGFEILLFVIPYAEEKKKTMKYSLLGIGIVTIVYTIIFVITLSQFGLSNLQRQTFPTIGLIKEIDLPGFFIENLDGLMVATWVGIIFGTLAPCYYASGKILANLFSTRSQDLFIIPLLPVIYIVSLIPQNLIEVNDKLGKIISYTGLISIVFMPILIYIIGYYKTRRRT